MAGKDKTMLDSAQHKEYLPRGDVFACLRFCIFLLTSLIHHQWSLCQLGFFWHRYTGRIPSMDGWLAEEGSWVLSLEPGLSSPLYGLPCLPTADQTVVWNVLFNFPPMNPPALPCHCNWSYPLSAF